MRPFWVKIHGVAYTVDFYFMVDMQDLERPAGGEIEKTGTHRLDKFRGHLVQKTALTKRDADYFEKMKKAWSWSCKMFSPQQVVQMLGQEYGHEKTHAYQIIRDAFELWGDAYELDKRGVSKTLIEAAHLALSIGIQERNSESILKAVKELKNLYKLDEGESAIPPDVAMPASKRVYVVNGNINIGAMVESEKREVVDGDAEEIY